MISLSLFTTVCGESWRAQAQQSDGDCGSHEENQGKMKPLNGPKYSRILIWYWLYHGCFQSRITQSTSVLFLSWRREMCLYSNTIITHTTERVCGCQMKFVLEDVVTHAPTGQQRKHDFWGKKATQGWMKNKKRERCIVWLSLLKSVLTFQGMFESVEGHGASMLSLPFIKVRLRLIVLYWAEFISVSQISPFFFGKYEHYLFSFCHPAFTLSWLLFTLSYHSLAKFFFLFP